MTSPLSALLIIGSAVVGPIEAQQRIVASHLEYHPNCIHRLGDKCGAVEIETLPQLCERAMREIGAEINAVRDDYAVGFMPDQSKGGIEATGNRVRCLPTPTGYRR